MKKVKNKLSLNKSVVTQLNHVVGGEEYPTSTVLICQVTGPTATATRFDTCGCPSNGCTGGCETNNNCTYLGCPTMPAPTLTAPTVTF